MKNLPYGSRQETFWLIWFPCILAAVLIVVLYLIAV